MIDWLYNCRRGGVFHWIFAVLQYFLAVAREQSITKAAQALHMTQPPLSRQLKELEEELGKQLLIRTSKKIILTEDGHAFAQTGGRIDRPV